MKKKLSNVVAIVIVFLSFLLALSTKWVIGTFGLLSPDELIFHLKVPLEGTSNELIVSFIKENVFVAASLTAVCLLVLIIPLNTYAELKIHFFRVVKTIQFAPIHFTKNHFRLFSVFLLVVCLGYSCFTLNIQDFIVLQFSDSSFIKGNYVDTKNVSITFPEKKRNLIYIYLESMETTYFSKSEGGAQGTDLAPELYNLEQANISFSNTNKAGGAIQAPGTGWTIAGMVAQTSGLPVKLPIDGNSYGGYNSFLPGAWTLGDILHKNGYKQVLLLGSDAAFGGRKEYFQEHGNYEMLDYNYAIKTGEIDKNYHVWWGYEDEKLFSYAKEELTKLSKSSAPFNLTFLTADTHFPDGYVCRLCKNEHESQYANVISCSSQQVTQFVSWVQQQDFYDNTTIVISGDHLSMDPKFFAKLDPSYERTTMNIVINSPITSKYTKNRDFCTFDMFPTTLASLGVSIKGEKLGLGTNLFSAVPTLAEADGKQSLYKELDKHSNFYNNTFLYP